MALAISGKSRKGLTLIEIVMTIALIAILATASSYWIGSNFENVRYEATRTKMEIIRRAILGNPGVDAESRRTSFGYFGDFGNFPGALSRLTTIGTQAAWAYNATLGIGAGWRGPYYKPTFNTEYNESTDEWGTAFVYNTSARTLVSYAADRATGGSVYNNMLIRKAFLT